MIHVTLFKLPGWWRIRRWCGIVLNDYGEVAAAGVGIDGPTATRRCLADLDDNEA